VIADDAEAIATATSRLLDDSTARRELGERARRFVVRHHSPKAYAARLEEIYEEAVASRPRVRAADG
jgi:glycosyltransferase involved in cell wall biosynthesis